MKLNEHQKEILRTTGGKLAVLAGAGSGKTTTTIELISKLHNVNRIPLERMFITTFTNKAGKDVKDKLKKKFGISSERLENLWIGTFHSLGYRYLKIFKKLKMKIILPSESKQILKSLYKQEIDEKDLSGFEEVYDSIEYHRNTNIPWEDITDKGATCESLLSSYSKEKESENLVDFTDILEKFKEELVSDKTFAQKFDWVLIDECQDLNFKQHEIIDVLATKNLMLVGDDLQSIYKWRGAVPSLFKEKIKVSDKVFPLYYNYRSTREILAFANVLIKQVPEFKGRDLLATKGHGEKPTYLICKDMAYHIFLRVKEDINRGIPLEEIAVLARSVKSVNMQNLLTLFRKDGIRYVLRGGDDRLDSPFVQAYLSLLKSLVAPTKIALVNSLSLIPKVGAKRAVVLAQQVLSGGIESLQDNNGNYVKEQAYRDFLELDSLYGKREMLLGGLDFIYKHLLVPKYGVEDISEAEQRKTLIFDLLYKYLMSFTTLQEGIDSLYLSDEDEEAVRNKVIVSTIHQSKGLQWESVHLANVNEHSLPHISAEEEGDYERFEEEFCLMYVACTRSKSLLRMYMPFMRGSGTYSKPNKMSRFIKQLYKDTKDTYMTLRVFDVSDEGLYKYRLYNKLLES